MHNLNITDNFYTPVSRQTVLCDWVWRADGRPHRFPHNNFSSVYRIFTKLGHMISLWKGKNPIYFGVIIIIPFDNLYRRAYFVMHTFLVINYISDYTIGNCCFSNQHTALRRKSKDWLARNQDNVRLRQNVYPQTVVSVSQHNKYSTKPVALVRSGPHHHLIEN